MIVEAAVTHINTVDVQGLQEAVAIRLGEICVTTDAEDASQAMERDVSENAFVARVCEVVRAKFRERCHKDCEDEDLSYEEEQLKEEASKQMFERYNFAANLSGVVVRVLLRPFDEDDLAEELEDSDINIIEVAEDVCDRSWDDDAVMNMLCSLSEDHKTLYGMIDFVSKLVGHGVFDERATVMIAEAAAQNVLLSVGSVLTAAQFKAMLENRVW